MKKIKLTVNNEKIEVEIDENDRLIDMLRERLHLTGTNEGCGEGECGACTVIMDGEIVNSCLVMAFQAEGSEIITIEGLEGENGLDPIQRAYIETGAVQCGFCIPGAILSSKALLDKNPDPSRDEIRVAISGNLCRCTGYNKMIDAVELAKEFREEE